VLCKGSQIDSFASLPSNFALESRRASCQKINKACGWGPRTTRTVAILPSYSESTLAKFVLNILVVAKRLGNLKRI
jgi:hypothetical protein